MWSSMLNRRLNAANVPRVCAAAPLLWGRSCSSLICVTATLDTTETASNVLRRRKLHLCVDATHLLGRLANAAVLCVATFVAFHPARRALQADRLRAATHFPTSEAQGH